jgi:phosphate transport system substrate-binding protein
MKRIPVIIVSGAILLSLFISACGTRTGGTSTVGGGTVKISGDPDLAALFKAAANDATLKDTTIQVTSTSSAQGLNDVLNGKADIAMADVFPTDANLDPNSFTDTAVALIPYAFIVSPDVTDLPPLSLTQIEEIYTGQLDNWGQLGGPDEPIIVYARPPTTGIRIAFASYLLNDAKFAIKSGVKTLDSNQQMIDAVGNARGGIGYALAVANTSAFAFNQSTVKPLMITDQTFSPSGITSGSYQFWGVAHFITSATANPSTSVMPAIINEYSKAVCLAAGGQGFMDYPSLPASLKNAHLPPGTTISTSDATGASATSAYLGRFGLPQLPIKYIGCL